MKASSKTIEIRRYQNRKLYDTRNSTYVTLQDIAALIKAGEDVVVIDNKTKDDITSLTLTQIIFEEEKRKKSVLPLETLKKIIQEGGESIKDFFGKTLDNSVTSISKAKVEAEKIIDRLKDELRPGEDGNIIQDVLHKTQDFSRKVDEKIKSTFESVTSVNFLQTEVKNLQSKIKLLEKRLREYGDL